MSDTPQFWDYSKADDFMSAVQHGMPPVVICVACNGGIQGKEYNENIPESADEIADSVHEAYIAGASIVHVHARDPKNVTRGATTVEAWLEVNSKIRERCPDIIINNTTGGDLEMTMDQRLACLDAKPEIASLNLTPDMSRFKLKARKAPLRDPRAEIDYDGCVPFTYGLVGKFAEEMVKRNVKPEMEIYHPGGFWVVKDLISKNLVRAPYLIQTVMGVQTSSHPTPDHIYQMLKEFPKETFWLCSGIGPFQIPLTTYAALMGGHVRVGLEDNVYYERGRKLRSNAEIVGKARRIAEELGRKIATPAEARKMLGLSATPTSY